EGKLPGLMARMVVQRTKNNGLHIIFKNPKSKGNQVLARNSAKEVLLETRGSGDGYFVNYNLGIEDFQKIQAIADEEREELFAICRGFDEQDKKVIGKTTTKNINGFLPSEFFTSDNEVEEFIALIERHNFRIVKEDDEKVYFLRPGESSAKHSGTIHKEYKRLVCWSSSTDFQPGQAYTMKEVKEILEPNNYSAPENSINNHPLLVLQNKEIVTAYDIMQAPEMEYPWLLENLMGTYTSNIIAGRPGSGKSAWARELALYIIMGKDEYCSYQLKTRHQSVLIICTEDNIFDIRYTMGMQIEANKFIVNDKMKNLHFIFYKGDVERLLINLNEFLSHISVDCTIVDTFQDISSGKDQNNSSTIRKALEPLSFIQKKHATSLLYIHHLTKSAGIGGGAPKLEHLLGSIGMPAVCRSALVLTKAEENKRYLSLVKSNFSSDENQNLSKELTYDNFCFTPTGFDVVTDSIGALNSLVRIEDNKIKRLEELAKEIFSDQELTHAQYVQLHPKSSATANRDWRHFKKYNLIMETGNGVWKLSNEN
ncbi:MAG: AAA family ATPase, partial [Bacteroidota bacterium]